MDILNRNILVLSQLRRIQINVEVFPFYIIFLSLVQRKEEKTVTNTLKVTRCVFCKIFSDQTPVITSPLLTLILKKWAQLHTKAVESSI
jgi:uncharacterized UBP type Zn finger protein